VVGLNLTAAAVDDPDQQFFENYACGAERNITGYCNPELEKQFERQSMEPDLEKRKKLVWEIDRKLQEDGARPIIFHYRAASCRQPYVKGLTIMVNSIYNGWRFEDVWLDRWGLPLGFGLFNLPYRALPGLGAAAAIAVACLAAESAFAQKPGGVLQLAHRDSPASMSTLEEVTISTIAPM